jgi:hypothetical protein
VESEENEHPVPDPNRTMINITNELSDTDKKCLKEEIMDEIYEKLMEKLQDMFNQKLQDVLKKYQDTTNKKLEKTQKKLNELRKDFNKHQSDKKEPIKKEIHEIRQYKICKRVEHRYGKPKKKKQKSWK